MYLACTFEGYDDDDAILEWSISTETDTYRRSMQARAIKFILSTWETVSRVCPVASHAASSKVKTV